MLTALKLYDHAEEKNFFGLPIAPEQVEFSLLGTALSYSTLIEFLGFQLRSDLKIQGLPGALTKRPVRLALRR